MNSDVITLVMRSMRPCTSGGSLAPCSQEMHDMRGTQSRFSNIDYYLNSWITSFRLIESCSTIEKTTRGVKLDNDFQHRADRYHDDVQDICSYR